jgi:hypothetical protein
MKKFVAIMLLGFSFFVACGSGFNSRKEVTKVTVSATPSSLVSGANSSVKAVLSISGTDGTINTDVDWAITGGGSLSKTSSSDSETITFTAPVLSSATNVKLKATSKQDSSKFDEVTLSVAAEVVPSFDLSVSPNPISATFSTMKSTVTITPINGFTGTVNLSLQNAPNTSISPSSVVVSGSGPVVTSVELVSDASANQTFASFFALPPVTTATLRGASGAIAREVALSYQQQKGLQFGFGETTKEIFRKIDVATDGSLLVAGETVTNVITPVDGGFRTDAVLIKYNPNGTEAWRRQWAGQNGLTAAFRGAKFASNGDIFVVGGQFRLVGNSYEFQPLVAKYSSDGNQIWVVPFEVTNGDMWALDFDSNNDLVVAGYVLGGVFPNTGLASSFGTYDAYIAKLSSTNGSIIWAKQFGTALTEYFMTVDVDSNGNITAGHASSGNFSGVNSNTKFDCVFIKLNSSGTELWRKQFGTANDDLCYSHFDSSGNILVAGVYNSDLDSEDAFIRKYDASGNLLWNNDVVTSQRDFGIGAIADATGNVYFMGHTQGNVAGINQGQSDIFLIKYNAAGVEQWRRQYGTSADESVRDSWNSMAFDANGNLIIQGSVGATAGATARDGFIIKLGR